MFPGASFLFLASVSISNDPYSGMDNSEIWKSESYAVYHEKREKLQTINAWVNSVPYSPEQKDDWLDSNTFFSNGGDCEDYALAKIKILRSQGVPAQQLRLVLVKNHKNMPHAVLLHTSGDMFDRNTVVLDSETDKILSLHKRKDLTPFVSFSQNNIYVHKNGQWKSKVAFSGLPQHGEKWAAVQDAYQAESLKN